MRFLLLGVYGLVTMASVLPMASVQQDFVEYSADLISRTNAMNTSWKAGPNFAGETVQSVLNRFGPSKFSPPREEPNSPLLVREDADDIPEEFDARTKWPQCPSIGRISDQGRCRSYWAFAAVGIMDDRYCISQGLQVNISADDALACSFDGDGYGLGCGHE